MINQYKFIHLTTLRRPTFISSCILLTLKSGLGLGTAGVNNELSSRLPESGKNTNTNIVVSNELP